MSQQGEGWPPTSQLSLGIQSYSQLMIGVSNHLRNTKYLGSITILSFGEAGSLRRVCITAYVYRCIYGLFFMAIWEEYFPRWFFKHVRRWAPGPSHKWSDGAPISRIITNPRYSCIFSGNFIGFISPYIMDIAIGASGAHHDFFSTNRTPRWAS